MLRVLIWATLDRAQGRECLTRFLPTTTTTTTPTTTMGRQVGWQSNKQTNKQN